MALGSMALTSFCSPQSIILHKSSLYVKPILAKTTLLHYDQLLKKAPIRLVARSSLGNEVFENRSEGIICYVDDDGEIICEGYDEGPRFHHQLSRTHHTRDAEFINLLHQRLLLIANGCETKNGGTDGANVLVQDDHLKWKAATDSTDHRK